jgi:hypothetical protein
MVDHALAASRIDRFGDLAADPQHVVDREATLP